MPRGRKATTETTETKTTEPTVAKEQDMSAGQNAMLEKFAKLVESQQKKIDELDRKLSESVSGKKLQGLVDTGADTTSFENFDIDDVLETPKVYFTYSEKKTLFSYTDQKTKKEIKLPFGNDNPITFKKVYAYKKVSRDGKGDRVHRVARCIVWSKKEAEFIESHPYYNISIFESIKNVDDIDSTFANVLEGARNSVGALSNHALVDRAKALGLDVLEDPAELRKSVIHAIAEQQMKAEKQRSKSLVEDTVRARSIVDAK